MMEAQITKRLSRLATYLAATLWLPSALAEPTQRIRLSGPAEIFAGDPISASVDAEGTITPGPRLSQLAQVSARPIVALRAFKSGLYAGTAGDGLYRVDAKGRKTQLLPKEKQVVSAVAERRGQVFAGLNPGARLVRIDRQGRSKTIVDLKAKYIWAILPQKRGWIVATGAPGQVLQISESGASKVLFKAEETHIRALLQHPKLGLLAGGGAKGILYRIPVKGPARALYDSEMEETTALAFDPERGAIYAALVSSSDEGALVANKIGPLKGDPKSTGSPFKRSEVVRVDASGHVTKLWTSNQEGALDLHFAAKTRRLYIATGAGPKGRGRVYAIDTAQRDRVQLQARLGPSLATRIVRAFGNLVLSTAPSGELFRISQGAASRSVYLSKSVDLERLSRVGRIGFEGARAQLRARTGHTKTPDNTWSSWSRPCTAPEGINVDLPRGRFLQFEVTLTGAKSPGQVKALFATISRMNLAPKISEVFLLQPGVYMSPMPKEREPERTVSLSESNLKELRGLQSPDPDDPRVRQGWRPGMMTVAWSASDPNKDTLIFRAELAIGERLRPLASDSEHAFATFDSRAYPDGRYRVRVTASDRPSNPPDGALTDARWSQPFVIDNTAPKVLRFTAKNPKAGVLMLSAEASDQTSPLRSARVSVGGGPWLMIPAKDGLLDAKRETLELAVRAGGRPGDPPLKKGPQTVLLRVEDAQGNTVTRSVQLELK